MELEIGVISMRRILATIAAGAVAVTGLVLLPPAASAADNIATIPVGPSPWDVAISPDGTTAYVSVRDADTLAVVSLESNSKTGDIGVGDEPQGVAVSADGSRVYVANYAGNSVSVVNTATTSVVATIPVPGTPKGLVLAPDGGRLYAALTQQDKVVAISTATLSVESEVVVGDDPHSVAITPDGYKALVTNGGDNTVSVLNLPAMAVSQTVPVGDDPGRIITTQTPMGVTLAYVSNRVGNSVSELTRNVAWSVTRTIPVPDNPQGLALSADGSLLYVTQLGAGSVAAVRLGNAAIVGSTPVGIMPAAVAVAPGGSRAVVADFGGGTATVVALTPELTALAAESVLGTSATGQIRVTTGTDAAVGIECVISTNQRSLVDQEFGLYPVVMDAPVGYETVKAVPTTVAANQTATVQCPFEELSRGMTYYYGATAKDTDGTGATSAAAEFTTRPPKVVLSKVVRKRNAVVLRWRAAPAAEYYQARIRKGGSYRAWRQFSQRKVRFGALSRGTVYKVQVRAGNDAGTGPRLTKKVRTK